MLNIFPTAEKKKILIEYRIRLAIVSIFAMGALAVASSALLAPAYILAVSKNKTSNDQLAALEKKYGDSAQEKELGAQIRDINTKILLLLSGDTTDKLTPSQAVASIINLKGSDIKISSFSYEATASQERIVLTGTASDRDSLSGFFETLKKDSTFTSVTMPISSYVKSENIDFSIVIERKTKTPAKK